MNPRGIPLVALLGLLPLATATVSLAAPIADTEPYAWATTAGWLNFKAANGNVAVYPDHLEGYVWAENLGWIRLGGYSGGGAHTYANDADADSYGINRDTSSGALSGFAWSANAGWINFGATGGNAVVDASTGQFSGDVWSENLGWVRLRGSAQDSTAYGVSVAGEPGACGGSDGGAFTETPSSNLCAGGSAGTVSAGASTYSWTCAGDWGGSDDACTATRNYLVTPSAGANGSIAPSTVQQVAYNATPAFTVTPASGYSASVGGSCGGSLSGTTFTTSPVTAGCSIEASFAVDTYRIGGSVSGLAAGESVVLQNNGGDDKSLTADGAFSFDTELADGTAYSVSVLTQPTGQTCTVSNGSGAVSGADVTDVSVNCSGAPSEDESTIEASAPVVVTGSAATILVTVRDAAGNPLPGITVTLAVDSASIDAGAVSIDTSPSDTDANGEARFTVSSSVEQDVRLKASFNPDLFITVRWADNIAGIPTLSHLGLALLGLLLAAIGGWRRRRG